MEECIRLEDLGGLLFAEVDEKLSKLVGEVQSLAVFAAFVPVKDGEDNGEVISNAFEHGEGWNRLTLVHVLHHHYCWLGHVEHVLDWFHYHDGWAVVVLELLIFHQECASLASAEEVSIESYSA